MPLAKKLKIDELPSLDQGTIFSTRNVRQDGEKKKNKGIWETKIDPMVNQIA